MPRIPGWEEGIKEAQKVRCYSIGGVLMPRVAHDCNGEWQGRDCPDCGAKKGQFHISSCDLERCPRCGGQASSCSCVHDADSAIEAVHDHLSNFLGHSESCKNCVRPKVIRAN
jgi:hypothetical protein